MTIKLCKDCRWAVNSFPQATAVPDWDWCCNHPSSAWTPPENFVTGAAEPPRQSSCQFAREKSNGLTHDDLCGPSGRYWEAKDAPPRLSGIVGIGEALAVEDDDEIGIVFTSLTTLLTVPVEISLCSDTPVVIAVPNVFSSSDNAAIRRWVVRHKAALMAHWTGEIDSAELVQRLKNSL